MKYEKEPNRWNLSDDELMHFDVKATYNNAVKKGKQGVRAAHKYIKREWRNGKWKYYYTKDQLEKKADNAYDSMKKRGSSALKKARGLTLGVSKKASNTYNSVKKSATSTYNKLTGKKTGNVHNALLKLAYGKDADTKSKRAAKAKKTQETIRRMNSEKNAIYGKDTTVHMDKNGNITSVTKKKKKK